MLVYFLTLTALFGAVILVSYLIIEAIAKLIEYIKSK